ncbi:hypothetical protein TRFO_34667 [Tritrichomonas foetus]|uniref:Uncharacterized protein n=1 Tax=Tritrichomonas foetus TaxID=1144522 RepID=A0A1J4JIL3_9EUKA|nr:hypothetical protein TRFO_34667 [Tritrichomonas foetus]|eukprot:OHS98974.1 hypothetical protein TRFO_34667 [Tritrichomonas foetus]
MKSFVDVFDYIDVPSPSSELDYLKIEEQIKMSEETILQVKAKTEKLISSFAVLFLTVQKSKLLSNLIINLLKIYDRNRSFINKENQTAKNATETISNGNQILSNQINLLNSELTQKRSELYDEKESIKRLNDDSEEMTQKCISFQNQWIQYDEEITQILSKINEMKDCMKQIIISQSKLRSKLSSLNLQINGAITDISALEIDKNEILEKLQNAQNEFHQKNKEIASEKTENEITKQKINEILIEIDEKEKDIKKTQKNIQEIYNEIQNEEISVNNVKICIPQLENQLKSTQETEETIKNEKLRVDQRQSQLDTLIGKKQSMIGEDFTKIEKKQKRYKELQNIFELRKLMLITALDDIDHKINKEYGKVLKYQNNLNNTPVIRSRPKLASPIVRMKFMRVNQTPQFNRMNSRLFPTSTFSNSQH